MHFVHHSPRHRQRQKNRRFPSRQDHPPLSHGLLVHRSNYLLLKYQFLIIYFYKELKHVTSSGVCVWVVCFCCCCLFGSFLIIYNCKKPSSTRQWTKANTGHKNKTQDPMTAASAFLDKPMASRDKLYVSLLIAPKNNKKRQQTTDLWDAEQNYPSSFSIALPGCRGFHYSHPPSC